MTERLLTVMLNCNSNSKIKEIRVLTGTVLNGGLSVNICSLFHATIADFSRFSHYSNVDLGVLKHEVEFYGIKPLSKYNLLPLKAPYSSKIDILFSKKG